MQPDDDARAARETVGTRDGPAVVVAPPGLRDRARAAVRAQIADLAMGLFVEHGFEGTTVDDIATAAGISPRSFYRYFGTKEGVIVDVLAGEGQATLDLLEQRPAEEAAWEALLAVLHTVVAVVDADPEHHLPTARLLLGDPVLRSTHLDKQARWQAMLVPALAARLPTTGPGSSHDAAARALAGAGLSCLDAAFTVWVEHGGRPSISALLGDAAAAVRGA